MSTSDDQSPGAHPVAVISHRYWNRMFGFDPSVVGKTIGLNGTPFTIIGVAPPEFFGVTVGLVPDFWVPMMMQGQVQKGRSDLDNINAGWLDIMGL
jgi:hypothetical protein